VFFFFKKITEINVFITLKKKFMLFKTCLCKEKFYSCLFL